MLFKMPGKEDMLRRLNTMEGADYITEAFYPFVLENAGRELSAEGIVAVLEQATLQYAFAAHSPVTIAVLEAQIPSFIEVLVDDRCVREHAIRFWQNSRGSTE